MDHSKIAKLVEELEMELNNGGFDQYFFNSSGHNAHETIKALRIIGAIKVANILESAISKFPNCAVPKSRLERQVVLELISPEGDAFEEQDSQFYAYPENITDLLNEYVGSH